ncbi:MAG: inorganic diphosphatase [Candidatus Altiarchaeota archaeon]
MEIIIETPKWSFIKYKFVGGSFVRSLVSPFPTLYNYGFAVGSVGGDGQPQDVLVLGRRLPAGTRLNANILGYVQFQDKGLEDNKLICVPSGRISLADRLMIDMFFRAYSLFKRAYYLFKYSKSVGCSYNGVILYNSK